LLLKDVMRSPRSIVAAFVSGVCLTLTCLPAQLSGDYTVDPTGTGSRNFKTLADAAMWVTSRSQFPNRKWQMSPSRRM